MSVRWRGGGAWRVAAAMEAVGLHGVEGSFPFLFTWERLNLSPVQRRLAVMHTGVAGLADCCICSPGGFGFGSAPYGVCSQYLPT